MLISVPVEVSLLAFAFGPRWQITYVCAWLMANAFYLLLCDFLASDQLDLLWRAIKCLSHLV